MMRTRTASQITYARRSKRHKQILTALSCLFHYVPYVKGYLPHNSISLAPSWLALVLFA